MEPKTGKGGWSWLYRRCWLRRGGKVRGNLFEGAENTSVLRFERPLWNFLVGAVDICTVERFGSGNLGMGLFEPLSE